MNIFLIRQEITDIALKTAFWGQNFFQISHRVQRELGEIVNNKITLTRIYADSHGFFAFDVGHSLFTIDYLLLIIVYFSE